MDSPPPLYARPLLVLPYLAVLAVWIALIVRFGALILFVGIAFLLVFGGLMFVVRRRVAHGKLGTEELERALAEMGRAEAGGWRPTRRS